MRIDALVLTCEHGGNIVPARYARAFESRRAQSALRSHRGHDIGALQLAKALQKRFDVPLFSSRVTRLLVELNRSIGHPRLFSEFVVGLTDEEREHVLRTYYRPHRQRVEQAIGRHVRHGWRTLHVSVHSFTPQLAGKIRTADVALLYDPARRAERSLCAGWVNALKNLDPCLRVRRNYPYRGTDDGLTTALRREFKPGRYLGIEIEVNQALLSGRGRARAQVTQVIGDSLGLLLEIPSPDYS